MKLEQILSPASMGMLNAYVELCMATRINKGKFSAHVGLLITSPFPMVDSRTTNQWHAVLANDPNSLPRDIEATVFAVGGVIVPGITPQTSRQWEHDNRKSISNHPTAVPACSFVVTVNNDISFYCTARIEGGIHPDPQWSTSASEHLYDCPMGEKR